MITENTRDHVDPEPAQPHDFSPTSGLERLCSIGYWALAGAVAGAGLAYMSRPESSEIMQYAPYMLKGGAIGATITGGISFIYNLLRY